ncbi:hypothetical protein SBA4_460018 [Candidatus Sulfopaludibacter sp. SbA4]|nr:hypothetical protein SBA4_460018 [Candidatus Sulfopaludibacter sp. SbA4]
MESGWIRAPALPAGLPIRPPESIQASASFQLSAVSELALLCWRPQIKDGTEHALDFATRI